jgi:hypothetical protein
MANRATEQAVLALMDTTLTAEQITPFLESANVVVTGKCTDASYSAEVLELIERWLAAHLASSAKSRQISGKKVGEASWEYAGKTGTVLDSTSYGQQVKLLDYKGTLADLSNIKGVAELKIIDV